MDTGYWGLWCVLTASALHGTSFAQITWRILKQSIEAAGGKGLETSPAPAGENGKCKAAESDRVSSWVRLINAAQSTIFLSPPLPQKCHKSPHATVCALMSCAWCDPGACLPQCWDANGAGLSQTDRLVTLNPCLGLELIYRGKNVYRGPFEFRITLQRVSPV